MRRIQQNPKARRPRWLYAMTRGKCFYCGCPTYDHGLAQERDWLFVDPRAQNVREHKIPVIRGGSDDQSNIVPSCRGCNSDKGAFTTDEFRLVCALEAGTLNYRFPFETPTAVQRDWLCCHSGHAVRGLVVHNMKAADDAYRLRNGWARGAKARGLVAR